MSRLFNDRELPASGEIVSCLQLDSNLTVFAGVKREHSFRIESSFTITTDHGDIPVVYDPLRTPPAVPTHITELSQIIDCELTHAKVYVTGELILEFASDKVRMLTVLPDAEFEAWSYAYGVILLHCPPGGDLTGAILR